MPSTEVAYSAVSTTDGEVVQRKKPKNKYDRLVHPNKMGDPAVVRERLLEIYEARDPRARRAAMGGRRRAAATPRPRRGLRQRRLTCGRSADDASTRPRGASGPAPAASPRARCDGDATATRRRGRDAAATRHRAHKVAAAGRPASNRRDRGTPNAQVQDQGG